MEVGVTTVPGAYGVIGLRVPAAIAYRHLAIRLVSTACKMALDAGRADRVNPVDGRDARDGSEAAPDSHPDSDGDFEAEVVSAFGEAFNNIAVHGYRDLQAEPVQIEVDWDQDKLVITFVDGGRTFNPALVALPDLDELPEHGMGLFIMRSCMDQVDYSPGPPNVLRLVKLRGRRDGLLPPPPSSAPRLQEALQEALQEVLGPANESGTGVASARGRSSHPSGRPRASPEDARARVGDDLMVESSRRR